MKLRPTISEALLTVTTGAPTRTPRSRSAAERARTRPSLSRHDASIVRAWCSNDVASSTARLQAVANRPIHKLIPSDASFEDTGPPVSYTHLTLPTIYSV